MSKMAEIDTGIRDMLNEGYGPVAISVRLGIPVYFVYDILESDEEFEELNPFNTINS
jgi:hypothetical protein